MMLLPLAQMAMDNPKLDLLYFLTGLMFAAVPTSVLGIIGFFVIRDWYRHHYRRNVAPAGQRPAAPGR
jgi:hypothetical protein